MGNALASTVEALDRRVHMTHAWRGKAESFRPRRTLAERFWPKVARRGADECWPWLACRDAHGYGRLNRGDGVTLVASRVAWELANGPIAHGLVILHSCDFPPCVNPRHLSRGTQAENLADMARKGRWDRRPRRGVKLRGDDRIAIAQRVASGEVQARIAVDFGVAQSTVSRAWNVARTAVAPGGRAA